MKKQYIQPALEQMMAVAETFVAASLAISNDAQDGISGDVKENIDWDYDDDWD